MSKKPDCQSAILEYIREKNKSFTIREIGEGTGISRNTIAKYLEVLVQQGELEEKPVGTAKLYSISQRVPGSIILRFVSEPVCIITSDLKIVSCNSSFEKNIAGNNHTVFQNSLDQLIPEIKDKNIIALIFSASHGEQQEYTHNLNIRGRSCQILLKFIPLTLSAGNQTCGILFHDQTGIQVLQSSLQESEERYRAIIDDQLDLVCRRNPDFTISYVNRGYCNAARRSSEELLGKLLFPFALSQNSLETKSVYQQVSPDTPRITIETRDIEPNGLVNWQQWTLRGLFSPDGSLLEYQAIGRDVTHFKRCEEKIRVYQQSLEFLIQERTKELQNANQELMEELMKREKNEVLLLEREFWFKALFNNISEPCILYEQMDGKKPRKIIEVNESTCRILQYTRDELLTMHATDITTEDHWNEYLNIYAKKLAETQVLTFRGIGKRKDGVIFPVEMSAHRFTIQNKSVVLVICRIIAPDLQAGEEQAE